MNYFLNLKKSMTLLSKNNKTIFLGQSVSVPGTAMFNTLTNVNSKKKLELPVAEEMQLGITLGMALNGFIPVSIYPRWNFLLLATNQLVNHMDKISEISEKKIFPTIIIRTSVGSCRPLDPQSQHKGDFTKAFSKICKNIKFVTLKKSQKIIPEYNKAIKRKGITVLVEIADFYNEK
jgi:pyruvate/2-oxoglutarate/acetoin dehydrogenase E1 component